MLLNLVIFEFSILFLLKFDISDLIFAAIFSNVKYFDVSKLDGIVGNRPIYVVRNPFGRY